MSVVASQPRVGDHVRVALVLGGGGVLGGAWEAGALEALRQETGWDPRQADYLVGTSAGALIAALLAAGIMPATDLSEAAAHRRRAFPWPIPGSLGLGISAMRKHGPRRWIMTAAGLLPRGPLSTRPIREVIGRRIPGGWPSGRRLWITATDYRSGERVVFGRSGSPAADLADAVAASCAIPGVYQPVEIGGRLYIDGGLYSATNLDLLINAGVDLAICLNPMSSPDSAQGTSKLANRLQALAEQATHRSLVAEAEALRQTGTPVVLIEPGPEDLAAMGLNVMNRTRAQFVFEIATKSVAGQLRLSDIRGRLGVPTSRVGAL
jgi:NTE family protein